MSQPAIDIDQQGFKQLQHALNHVDAVHLELAERKLRHFVYQAWHVVEPARDFLANWHIDAICDHAEAVMCGDIQNLVINIPPRFMKSLNISVMWPAWSWINTPQTQWLTASYAQALATRDSVKTRRLLKSAWYQSRWGDRFSLTGDQNAKQRYENDKGGHRIATSVDGSNTGEGGDILVVDDPHNIKEAESDTVRINVLTWWDEVMTTRLNNPKTGSKVIIMQRTHEDDLAGHVLEEDHGYEHLCLPLEFEPKRKCFVNVTGFQDPRSEEGELLWPERVDDTVVTQFREVLGEYAYAGQMQQRPAPRAGGMFKTDRLVIVDEIPCAISVQCRSWDKAATPDGGAQTAGIHIAQLEDQRWIILDSVCGQWDTDKREAKMRRTAELDGVEVSVILEQEPGSGGKDSAQASIRNLSGFIAEATRPTGDKVVRADPFSVQVNNGNVLILRGEWNKPYINELEKFPVGKFKDQVDASSQGFNFLAIPAVQVF